MKFPKTLKLKTAAHDRVPFDLSGRTITTGEFYQFAPVKMIECVPGDKIDINMTVFTRTAPLSVPSFDRAVVQSRAFFVPARLCYPMFNEFITGEKVRIGDSSVVPVLPYIDSDVLTLWFATGTVAGKKLATDDAAESDKYDFSIIPSGAQGATAKYYMLTALGRKILKIFQGLGYRWNWRGPYDLDHDQFLIQFSALPLFAFFKVYLDWFVPSQLQAAHPIAGILNKWRIQAVTGPISSYELSQLFESMSPAYDEDYFTAAWLYPNDVGGDTARILPGRMLDYVPTDGAGTTYAQSDKIQVNSGDTNIAQSSGSALYRLSQYGLNLLQGMANYVTRNNYAGSRAVEQILARFGVRVPDTRLNRSEFIGADNTDIQFAEVTATADSGDYKVGEFAGKGVALGRDGHFSVECKEHGYVVVVSTIVPKISYVQGFDRCTLHRERFDFFTPEFDCVGLQAIASGELYADMMHPTLTHGWVDLQFGNGKPSDIFGYCPRYAEFKTGRNLLLGDFNIPHLNDDGALNAYHFSRMFYPSIDTPAQAQGKFLFADGEQYNRIFNVTDEIADHFYMWYNFDIKAYRPMRSIADSIPLDGDGEKVAQQPNGVHMS